MKKEDNFKNKTKSLDVGWKSVAVVMTFLIIWRVIHNEGLSDILMILFAYNGGESFYNYIKMPEKKHFLIIGIFSALGFGLALSSLFSQYGIY